MSTTEGDRYRQGYADALAAVRAEFDGSHTLYGLVDAIARVKRMRPPAGDPEKTPTPGWSVTLVPQPEPATAELPVARDDG